MIWCVECRDRPARHRGHCIACYVKICRAAAPICILLGDVKLANELMWDADQCERLLGLGRVEIRRDA